MLSLLPSFVAVDHHLSIAPYHGILPLYNGGGRDKDKLGVLSNAVSDWKTLS